MKHCPASQIDRADMVEPASIDLDECIERLYKKELLAESVIEAICAKAKELLMKESNVVHIAAPVTVVGDIHGQFFDMLEIFKIGGFCPNTNYLFLGKLLKRPEAGKMKDQRSDAHTQAIMSIAAFSVSKRFLFLSVSN
jgi:surface polysaccharide O-acyltransferase-like enzyme